MPKLSSYPAATNLTAALVPVVQDGVNKTATPGLFATVGGTYNVLDPTFGAKGNGITDDTNAIQNAINAAGAAGGGVVLLPTTNASYLCSDLVVPCSNVILRGLGGGYLFGGTWTGSVIKAKAGTTNLLTVGTNIAATQTISSSQVEGISLDGNNIAAVGLLIQTAANCTFRNVMIQQCATAALKTSVLADSYTHLNYVYSCAFENLWLKASATGKGMWLSGSPTAAGGNRTAFCSFKHMHVTHQDGQGIYIDNADDNSFFNIGFSLVGGGTGRDLELDGAAAGANSLVHSNHFFFIWGGANGIYSHGSHAVHNTVYSQSTEDASPAPTISAGSQLGYTLDDGTMSFGSLSALGGSSLVNQVLLTGTASGAGYVQIAPTGSDTNMDMRVASKGSGRPSMRNSFGNEIGAFQGAQNVVNRPVMTANLAGGAVLYGVEGSDVDIDLRLVPQGAGVVRFGSLTASADAPVSGYVTIKDSSGVTRKLAVIT